MAMTQNRAYVTSTTGLGAGLAAGEEREQTNPQPVEDHQYEYIR